MGGGTKLILSIKANLEDSLKSLKLINAYLKESLETIHKKIQTVKKEQEDLEERKKQSQKRGDLGSRTLF